MSDWQVGDLAVCVDDSPRSRHNPGEAWPMKAGSTWRVNWVGRAPCGELGLGLDGAPPTYSVLGYSSHRFRKIRPDAHEGDFGDWELLIETHKRKVSA